MRAFIRWLDSTLRRIHHVYEFTDDPRCVLRMQITITRHPLRLDGQTVGKGEPVLFLHFWNEHAPIIPATGPDLTWAMQMRRTFVHSLYGVGRQFIVDPRLATIRAVGGPTGVLIPGGTSAARLMERLGFEVMPYHSPLGGFGEFWENLYSYGLMYLFQPASFRHRRLFRLQRTEMWMTVDAFRSRYGREEPRAG